MTINAVQTQGQRVLGHRQLQAMGLLPLTSEALAEHLLRRAAENPLIRLRLPARAAFDRQEELPAAEGGFYDHVLPQLGLIVEGPRDRALALAFVEALDANGWLDRPVAEIAAGVGRSRREAEVLLARIQRGIEPTGLFARDLADCLRLQAAERDELTPVMQAVLARLPLLAEGGVAAVATATGLPQDQIARCAAQIRRMSPRPGLAFGAAAAPLRVPDVIVSRLGDGWQVRLNRATLPAIAILPATDPALKAARAEADRLLSGIERRNRTILAVARAVLTQQRAFLDRGPSALVALRRTEIAARLGLHDSTVGRIARDLLVETPQGMRSLCSLFDGGPAGGAAASAAIRHRLAELVAAERGGPSRSDPELAAMLAAEGMAVARRTVAKFRDELGIPAQRARRRAHG